MTAAARFGVPTGGLKTRDRQGASVFPEQRPECPDPAGLPRRA
jgi:hypothetical protein